MRTHETARYVVSIYVYEERSHTLVRGGRVRWRLEGVADSLLKGFGI